MSDQSILHITNGDSASRAMRAAGIEGEILTWDDPLHDGPAPAGLSMEDFSEVRADFVADCGWGDRAEIRARFRSRDRTLQASRRRREAVLWYEHDLYDQLQLIQILDWLAGGGRRPARLSLAQSDDYLAEIDGSSLVRLFETRRPVGAGHLGEAREAWNAFTNPDPSGLATLARRRSSRLPFLADALRRHLEEFPWSSDGLSRSEREILRAVAAGARGPVEIFKTAQARENPRYLGDWSFWLILERLHQGPAAALEVETGIFRRPPLIELEEFRNLRIRLTETGRSLVAGRVDWIRLNGCDRWLGGARLGPGSLWRWDPETERVSVRGNSAR